MESLADFFSNNTRKKNTMLAVESLKSFFLKFNKNKNTLAYFIAFMHTIVGIFIAICLIFGNGNTLLYKFCATAWIAVVFLHFYFNGCLLVRLERDLWNSRTWLGPWMAPKYILTQCGVDISSDALFYLLGTIITIVMFIRLFSAI